MSSLPRWIGWLLCALGLVLIAYAWQNRQPHTTSDFTLFYDSASNPPADMYKPPRGLPRGNMNPPHFQLLMRPLTWLPLDTAAVAWRTLNVAALVGCLWWIARFGDERWDLADLGAVMTWAPMFTTISLNQLTWLLWPPLLWAWWCWRRGRWIAGSIGLGIALSFKSFLGLFLLWLILKREWRAAAAAIATAAACLGIGIAAYGIGVFRDWMAAVGAVSWWNAGMNGSFTSLPARLFMGHGSVSTPFVEAPAIVYPLAAGGGVVIIVVTLVRTWRRDADGSWAALASGALLASPLGWIYYGWWILPGIRPSRLLVQSPLLWVPPILVTRGRESPWHAMTIGSVYFWALLLVWLRQITAESAEQSSPVRPETRSADSRSHPP